MSYFCAEHGGTNLDHCPYYKCKSEPMSTRNNVPFDPSKGTYAARRRAGKALEEPGTKNEPSETLAQRLDRLDKELRGLQRDLAERVSRLEFTQRQRTEEVDGTAVRNLSSQPVRVAWDGYQWNVIHEEEK